MAGGKLTVLVAVPVSEEALEDIKKAAGDARVLYAPDEKEAEELVDEADVVYGMPSRERVEAAPRLRWLQTHFAGVDKYTLPTPVERPGFILTNARGIYGVAGAEHVLGWMLMFNRGLVHFYRFQQQAQWNRRIELARKLAGQTLGIVGLGDIGGALAVRARAFGMRVLAIRRHPAPAPELADEVWGLDRLGDLLAQSDHVALTLPLTRETRGIINRNMLARMKPTAYLYNIGRGPLVDEEALLEALHNGTIAGAGLDVFAVEPLPPDHPLWRAPNVLITPHLGADSPSDLDDAARLFADNLARFRAGQPLRNVVDLARGY